jgi:hypothetical protein
VECSRTCASNLICAICWNRGLKLWLQKDATAAPRHPEWGYGYTVALINFEFLAHAMWTTKETVKAMERRA